MKNSKTRYLLAVLSLFLVGAVNQKCGKEPPHATLLGESVVTLKQVVYPDTPISYYYEDLVCATRLIQSREDCVAACSGTPEEIAACDAGCWNDYYADADGGCYKQRIVPNEPNFCFGTHPATMFYNPSCLMQDPGFTAVDYYGNPLSAEHLVVVGDDIDCSTPGTYTRTYRAQYSGGFHTISRTVVIEPDTEVDELYIYTPTPWVRRMGQDSVTSYSIWAQDGCQYPEVDVDTSYIPRDADGKFDTPGTYPVIFSTRDAQDNYKEEVRDLTIDSMTIVFPGGFACQDAQVLGSERTSCVNNCSTLPSPEEIATCESSCRSQFPDGGTMNGEWARYCRYSPGICTRNEDCTDRVGQCFNFSESCNVDTDCLTGKMCTQAGYCSDPSETCSIDSDCANGSLCNLPRDYCVGEYVYVGPNNGPYGEPTDEVLIARLKYYDSVYDGMVYDPHPDLPDMSRPIGTCYEETDYNRVWGKLVYSCPSPEQYLECATVESNNGDVDACLNEWEWSGALGTTKPSQAVLDSLTCGGGSGRN